MSKFTRRAKQIKTKHPVPIVERSTNVESSKDDFERELYWCVQKLQRGLADNKHLDARQAAESKRILNILKSSAAPLVKKRQVMRSTFGDYRAKMKQEEKQYGNYKTARMNSVTDKQKLRCTFLRKSAGPKDNFTDRKAHSVAEIAPGFQFEPSGGDFKFDFGAADKEERCTHSSVELPSVSKPDSATENGAFEFNFKVDIDSDMPNTEAINDLEKDIEANNVTSLSDSMTSMSVTEATTAGSQRDTEVEGSGLENPFHWQKSTGSFSFNFQVDDAK